MVHLSSTSEDAAEGRDVVLACHEVFVEYPGGPLHATTFKEAVIARLKGRSKGSHRTVLKNACLEVRKGECVALVGHNGSGKSTLLKAVAGIVPPKRGQVRVRGRLAPLIELGAGFDSELTGRENVYLSCSLLGLTRAEIDARIGYIEEFAELGSFFEEPVKTYSSGMYMRLGFSCAVAIDASIMLIDEILAVGDANFQRKCLDKIGEIRRAGTTFLIVSHDANVIRQLAERVVVLDRGEIVFTGPAIQGLKFYQDLMNGKLQERNMSLPPVSDRDSFGGRAQITRVRVIPRDGGQALISGKPWSLSIGFEIHSELDQDPTLGFTIHSETGIRVFGGNSRLFKLSASDVNYRLPGSYEIEFLYDLMPLSTGNYRLTAAIHDASLNTTYDLVTEGHYIEVSNSQDLNNLDRDIVSPMLSLSSVAVRRDTNAQLSTRLL